MEITDSRFSISKADPETYGKHLLSVHSLFPNLTLHEVQDRIVELVNSPQYAEILREKFGPAKNNGHVTTRIQ